jgi:hypothetical protein
MTGTVRRLANVVAAVVLVVSGAYLMIYLYRWEWNRAMVAGLFFVATEVAVVSRVVLGRLRHIERKLDALTPSAEHHAEVVHQLRATAPPPNRSFAWLERRNDSLNVFVPFLLGAGVLLSAFASVVERLASVTAVPAMEHRLARRLDALALPAGGLLGVEPTRMPSNHSRNITRLSVRLFAVLAIVLLTVASVNTIAEYTQDDVDPRMSGSTSVTLEISRRNTTRSITGTAEALFIACRHTVGHSHVMSDLTIVNGNAKFLVAPAIGEHATRRFVGCLEDALFDRVSANVHNVSHVP